MKRLQIQRNAKKIALPQQAQYQMFYFKITIANGEIEKAEQIPDFPFEHTDDNGSILTLQGTDCAVHVTWLPFKPEPRTELRYKGYLAIYSELGKRDPALAEYFSKVDIGFGHAEGAKVEWNPTKGDDA